MEGRKEEGVREGRKERKQKRKDEKEKEEIKTGETCNQVMRSAQGGDFSNKLPQ